MAPPLAFSVRRLEPELVAPAKPTPRELKPLSDMEDQEGLYFDVPLIMFYRADPSMEGKDPVKVIRDALAAALVFYYPLAGKLVRGANRRLMVDCTAEGVLFVEADADIRLEELGDAIMPPCPNLEELVYMVPGSDGILGCPLRSLQVTRLSCGGFIVSLLLSHTTCDGAGIAQFLKAIGEIARGAHAPSPLPVWEREMTLAAHCPPRVTCSHHEYEELEENPNSPPLNWTPDDMVQSSAFFGSKEIRALRAQLPPNLEASSSFEIIAACLMRCRTIALEHPPDEVVRISFTMNVRHRILPRVPDGYYGNAFVYPAQVSMAEWVCKNSLGHALELVKKVKAQVNEEYVRSFTDFHVINGRRKHNEASLYIISDTRRIGFEEVDFGWGNPMYSGPAAALGIMSFLVRYKGSSGADGTVASIVLPKEAMKRFHQELKTMTQEEPKKAPRIKSLI